MTYLVKLTPYQQSALLSILIEHVRRPDSTREWINIVDDSVTSVDDLLRLIATAPVIEEVV